MKIADTRRISLFALGCIVLITILCLFPTLRNGWVNWDDPSYVLRNSLIHDLSYESIQNIFLTPELVGLYHPLTLISLAIDYHFWELDPFGYHLSNLIFHLFNTALVFFLFRKLQASILVAGIVALLFGMHPMHVESVAWISARKDVLYVFFFLLSIISYLKSTSFVGKKRVVWLILSLLAFSCSLLSKNIAFTLPFILILIDFLNERKMTLQNTLIKLPFFVFAIIAMLTAQSGQVESNSMSDLSSVHFGESIFYGMYNTVFYIFKAIVPVELSAFHPFPNEGNSMLIIYLSLVPFLAFLYFVYWSYRRSRKIFFGIAFFFITIAPLLQIIPFGKALSSERYTYLPYLGLFYLIALFVQFQTESSIRGVKSVAIAGFVIWVALIGTQTRYQSSAWENSEVLWTQVIDQYPNCQWAYMSRGLHYAKEGELTLAIEDLNKSIEIEPFAQSLYERGILLESGDKKRALQDYYQSIQIDPTYARSHLNIGVIMAQEGQFDKAIKSFEKAIKYDSEYSMAYFNCATALKINGDTTKAMKYYSTAISLEPKNSQYLIFRGVLSLDSGKNKKAIRDFSKAIQLGNNQDAYYLRSVGYFKLNQLERAYSDALKAQLKGYPLPEGYLKKLAK